MAKLKNTIKRFFKELKRVRWPDALTTWKTFYVLMFFIVFASVGLFLIALGFTTLWAKIGVGLNG